MKKMISLIIPAYNEEAVVEELARQLKAVFAENGAYDFEVIIVENGSTDGTFQKLLKIHEEDPRFKIVQLSRNFRMDGGMTAGLDYARGDAAIIMTANLQDPPSLIPRFIEKWESGYEHVYGVVKRRPGKGLMRRLNSKLFYFIINKLTNELIPKNASDTRLIDRKVYETVRGMEERNRFMRGLFVWVGFKSTGIDFERNKRFAGESHAHFSQVLQLAVQGIFAYSYLPIKLISGLGIFLSGMSLLYLVYTVIHIFVKGVPFHGYGTLISAIILMFGFLFLILGILGQYIAQIYEEVKARPNFIVRSKIGFDREN
jgi:glycosyltransferase involved in cell wall biosynthesis